MSLCKSRIDWELTVPTREQKAKTKWHDLCILHAYFCQ